MKILILTEYLAPQINGIAIRFEYYIKYLRKFGHDVTVYGPPNSKISDIKMRGITNPWNKENSISINTGVGIFIDIIKNNYDLIHIVYPLAVYANVAMLAAKIKNTKIVCSNHVDLIKYNDSYISNKIFK